MKSDTDTVSAEIDVLNPFFSDFRNIFSPVSLVFPLRFFPLRVSTPWGNLLYPPIFHGRMPNF
jgi:hypothetical protein